VQKVFKDPDHILGIMGSSGRAVHIEIGVEGAMYYETAIRFRPYNGIVKDTPTREGQNEFRALVTYKTGEEVPARIFIGEVASYPDTDVTLEFKGETYSARTNLFLVELKTGEIVQVDREFKVNQIADQA
jgi:hypothetical protein